MIAIAIACALLGPADAPKLDEIPPVVVAASPAPGDDAVDPKTTAIRVTFNKRMAAKSWSWVQHSQDSFPKLSGEPKYEADGKTCILPVKLEPNKTYVVWINSEKFRNFKDEKGQSAVPYVIAFHTSP